jgi:hypothetical protein
MCGGLASPCNNARSSPDSAEEAGDALVVFVDDCSLKSLRFLRRGFRHCFVVVRTRTGWVICDPLSHRTDLAFVEGCNAAELTRWYRDHGLRVIATRIRPAPLRPAPIRPYTCVEAVKRVLGMHAPWILTPWQLYRRLSAARTENPLTDDLS